ncbi:MAG: hypothetical protein QS748_10035 [Candidatus Endonucleobacter bathymodioli]|uniref:Uncharacterized protein n=1 Tax=Candidatus Endonucleibacter bathymodioli TaxID=539814 RepID=A0AA90NMJ1_9GAMM|nr:hypothetical protein [Candidatus Endonucleobacter bathymodioli]
MNESDTLTGDNTRKLLECYDWTKTQLQAVHKELKEKTIALVRDQNS